MTGATLRAALGSLPELFHRQLDRIVVKGRSKPVEIFELWDTTINRVEGVACRELYESALGLYFKGDWELALSGFEESLLLEPSRSFSNTTPSKVLAERCREFMQSGGPKDWDGAYRMSSK